MAAEQNVEVVRRVNAAFNSGDMGRILALMDPDFETTVGPDLSPEPDTYRGHDGIRRYFDSFREAMSEIRFDADRFREADGRVIVAVRLRARGRFTGIAVEQRLGQVWTISGGKALRLSSYPSYRAALRAAGAGEPAARSA
jgi:ketosteroid isomerase-like protein